MALAVYIIFIVFFQAALRPFPLIKAEISPDVASKVEEFSPDTCTGNTVEGCKKDFYETGNLPENLNQNIVDAQAYTFDRLSDRDSTVFKSRGWSQADGQETSLKQVLFMHRHGDRTPISFGDRDEIAREPFWKFHGLGQLTNRGKARLHMLGKLIRERYNKFVNNSVNKMWRKSRSSGALRCIESAQMFLSSFLGLDVAQSPDARSLYWLPAGGQLGRMWQPASITSLSAKFDGMLNEGAECVALNELYEQLDQSEASKDLLTTYKLEAQIMNETIGFEIDHFYKWFWASSLLEVERSYFENKMKPGLLQIFDRLQNAGTIALNIYQSTLQARRLRAGLVINDMINQMKNFRDSSEQERNDPNSFVKKFVHYSSHDLNLVVLLGMLNQLDKYPERPDYAANIIIELHQDDRSGWFIKFFYVPHVPSEPIELHVEICERDDELGRCTLEKFDQIMEIYKIDSWLNWMKECKNDLQQVDPYTQNP